MIEQSPWRKSLKKAVNLSTIERPSNFIVFGGTECLNAHASCENTPKAGRRFNPLHAGLTYGLCVIAPSCPFW